MTATDALGANPARLRQHVAEELRVLLARRRMSGVELARRIGKSHTYVWRRLNGETAFDLDDLERMAAVLDVEPVDLLPVVIRRPGQPTPPRVAPAVRPPDRRPKDKPGSDRAGHRTRLKRTLTTEERSLIAV